MTSKFQTKLLKNVLKRSQLSHSRFCGSSWTKKINETEKKPSCRDKTGEKFRSKVAKLSIGKSWSEIRKVCNIGRDLLCVRNFSNQ